MKDLISRSEEERIAEVCLDGVFGRGYRKFVSAILAGFGVGRRRKDAQRLLERAFKAVERGESTLIESLLCYSAGTCSTCSTWVRVAPVLFPSHLFPPLPPVTHLLLLECFKPLWKEIL
jgi:hypothetical protein